MAFSKIEDQESTMNTLAKYILREMHVAWITLIGYGIGMYLAWQVGRHGLYWMFAALYGLFGGDAHHWGSAPPESQILGFEVLIGWIVAYLFGALVLTQQWITGGFAAVGRSQNVSPALLYFAGQNVARGMSLWLFPVALVVLVPYLVWLSLLFVLTLVGAQGALRKWLMAQDAAGDVIDINGRHWRPRPRPRTIA